MKKWFSFLLMIAAFSSCTRNFSEIETTNFTGVVKLSGESDYSGVTVSLYPAAEIDTVLINRQLQFPSIAPVLSQSLVFDHRTVEPIYTTQTDVAGFFQFSDIPVAEYNLVVERRGFGWKYFYDVNETSLLTNITLYPEQRLSGVLDTYSVWSSYRHIVVSGDITVPEGGTLLIDKGAVVRFDGYHKLTVNGQLTTIGSPDEMVCFTANTLDRLNSANWRTIEIKGNGQISYSRFDYADVGVNTKGGILTVDHSVFTRIRDRGVLAANESNVQISESLFWECNNAVRIEGGSRASIHHNMIAGVPGENVDGAGIVSNNSQSTITDNGLFYSGTGCSIEYAGQAEISHNFISGATVGLQVVSLIGEKNTTHISSNTIQDCSNVLINILDNAAPTIDKNNLTQDTNAWFIRAYSLKYLNYDNIYAQNNYFASSIAEVKRRIEDKRTHLSGITITWNILIDPVSEIRFDDAGPR
ncbi:MAG: right-handed parallel beta-helix repeat-containing protein [Calditrichaeota bacterium]|nr:MAG: right-handed parallel beta-helix repeat-containing protein [Calditrichota bacterium]